MISGVIFDVDGTLLDSMAIWHDVSDRYLQRRGIEAPPGLSDLVFTMTLPEGCRYIKDLFSLPDPAEQMEEDILSEIRDFYYNEAQLKPGAREFLTVLRDSGIPLAVATAGVRQTHEAALARLGILDLFREIFVCSELSTSKREPEIYLRAARALGAAPEHICVFEDALYAVRTAKAAGFRVIGVADDAEAGGRDEIKNTADAFINDFYGAHDIIKRL